MQRLRLAIPLALILFLADCTTKELAMEYLAPEFTPHSVAGDVVRFTLAYNRGAAMSLPIGPYAKWPLIALSVAAVALLLRFIWTTPPTSDRAPNCPRPFARRRRRQFGEAVLNGFTCELASAF
jgi:lipoprotein signal peptidase